MVLDLFTVSGFLLFLAVVAALVATHDYHREAPEPRPAAQPEPTANAHLHKP